MSEQLDGGLAARQSQPTTSRHDLLGHFETLQFSRIWDSVLTRCIVLKVPSSIVYIASNI